MCVPHRCGCARPPFEFSSQTKFAKLEPSIARGKSKTRAPHALLSIISPPHTVPRFTLGLIGGSGLLKTTLPALTGLTEEAVDTPLGRVLLRVGPLPGGAGTLVFVQRHDATPSRVYTQPADINYPAIALALKQKVRASSPFAGRLVSVQLTLAPPPPLPSRATRCSPFAPWVPSTSLCPLAP